ncbi:cupin-like domain-containing protein [Polymorphobacter sp.]|uniref:cupin-like domain-containing protein n=1 Tax=Polymorphobacter sp. TaxID=1909290 RepID=UPI003F6EFC07
MARTKPPALDDALRTEIASLLLAGQAPDRIAARIASRGIPGPLAAAEVARAEKSPYLAGARPLQARLAKRDWLLANAARLQRLAGDTVPTIHALDAQRFFTEFYIANLPVKVSGLVDHWPARRWSFAGLAQALGGVMVDVQHNRETNRNYEIDKDRHTARQPFGPLLRRIVEDGPSNDFYVTAYNSGHNKQALASLWNDVGDIPGWLTPQEARDGFVWIGPAGTITPFHHDLTNNLLVQFVGEKRVKLVSAAETPRMRNHLHCFSDWRGEDLPTGPGDASKPPVMEVTLHPGEALFLPVGWWHHVEGLSPTIGMSFINFARDNDFYSHYASYGPL